jgi:hypothetical protein
MSKCLDKAAVYIFVYKAYNLSIEATLRIGWGYSPKKEIIHVVVLPNLGLRFFIFLSSTPVS